MTPSHVFLLNRQYFINKNYSTINSFLLRRRWFLDINLVFLWCAFWSQWQSQRWLNLKSYFPFVQSFTVKVGIFIESIFNLKGLPSSNFLSKSPSLAFSTQSKKFRDIRIVFFRMMPNLKYVSSQIQQPLHGTELAYDFPRSIKRNTYVVNFKSQVFLFYFTGHKVGVFMVCLVIIVQKVKGDLISKGIFISSCKVRTF